MKSKDQRSRLAIDRIKKQLDETNKNNEALSDKIKYYEDMRIKNMNIKGNNKPKKTNQNINNNNLFWETNENQNNNNFLNNNNNVNIEPRQKSGKKL